MTGFWQTMGWPFAACLVFAGIHAYLGYHVVRRQVIFVDLALAQIVALGSGAALLAGYGSASMQAYGFELAFAVTAAAAFGFFRLEKHAIPQEAVIGIVYAVSAALLVMVLSRSGEGDQHLRMVMTGNILLVTPREVMAMAGLYAVVGTFHFIFREKFFAAPTRKWDFWFYLSFAAVITSSVRIAGVLVVFAFLIVPPVCAMLVTRGTGRLLAAGWAAGFAGSLGGMILSYGFDFPTGASIVCALGGVLILMLTVNAIRSLFSRV